MKPIGTITMFYPFLDKDTIGLIDSVVNEALHHYDFVQKLVKLSENFEMTSPIAQVAVIQAWLIDEPDIWEMVQPRCEEALVMKPFSFWRFWKPGKTIKDFNTNFYPALSESLSTRSDDWLLLHLYMSAARMSTDPEQTKNVDLAVNLVEEHPELICFSSFIHQMKGYRKSRENDLEGALEEFHWAIEISREYNDVVRESVCLSMMGGLLVNHDPQKALTYFDEVYSLVKDILHLREAVGDAASSMAFVYHIFGEYDLALELHFEGQNWNPREEISAWSATNVAWLYCDLEMPEQALEWLKGRSEIFDFTWPYLHSAMARVLVQLGRLDETLKHLESAHKLTLALGEDNSMMYYLHALGLLELAKNNLDAAEDALQNALQIATERNSQKGLNDCLLALTRVEIAKVGQWTKQDVDVEFSGPWMSHLEKHARTKDYPGIRMRFALLKSEYQIVIGARDEAQLTLKDALTLSDSPGLKTLHRMIRNQLDQIV